MADEPFLTELFERAIDEGGVLGDVLLEPQAANAPSVQKREGKDKEMPGPSQASAGSPAS
jgi:hypothetical protein